METPNTTLNLIQRKSILLSLALALGALLLFSSCGSRKTNATTVDLKVNQTETEKETVKEETKKETAESTNITTEHKVETKNNIVTETVKVTPIDNSKPAYFKDAKGKTIYLTNSVYENQIKTDLSDVKEQLNKVELYYKKELETALKQSEKDRKTIIALQEKLKKKQSERKSGFPWWIILVIACIVSVLIYFELKKAPKV